MSPIDFLVHNPIEQPVREKNEALTKFLMYLPSTLVGNWETVGMVFDENVIRSMIRSIVNAGADWKELNPHGFAMMTANMNFNLSDAEIAKSRKSTNPNKIPEGAVVNERMMQVIRLIAEEGQHSGFNINGDEGSRFGDTTWGLIQDLPRGHQGTALNFWLSLPGVDVPFVVANDGAAPNILIHALEAVREKNWKRSDFDAFLHTLEHANDDVYAAQVQQYKGEKCEDESNMFNGNSVADVLEDERFMDDLFSEDYYDSNEGPLLQRY